MHASCRKAPPNRNVARMIVAILDFLTHHLNFHTPDRTCIFQGKETFYKKCLDWYSTEEKLQAATNYASA
ncbi:hypothetical protein KXD40_007044 [Peronospora effusa]|nr:hypothetical protein KXD40_007044 [Peronospora effusa]